ncbi:MAG: hypothetical protein ACJA0V_004035 [Planctomycetota bacterium]|jgi:hypothetical protein
MVHAGARSEVTAPTDLWQHSRASKRCPADLVKKRRHRSGAANMDCASMGKFALRNWHLRSNRDRNPQ